MRFVVFLIGMVAVSGCAGAGYFADRGQDAADIFNITVGLGSGVGTRLGPLHAGIGVYSDAIGVRGGKWINIPMAYHDPEALEVELTAWSSEIFMLKEGDCGERHKSYGAQGYPLISYVLSGRRPPNKSDVNGIPGIHPYYLQFDVFAGLLGCIRVGFNLGELVDFLLGWFTIDIFNDDLGSRERQTKDSDR